jgi:hypothetical protein
VHVPLTRERVLARRALGLPEEPSPAQREILVSGRRRECFLRVRRHEEDFGIDHFDSEVTCLGVAGTDELRSRSQIEYIEFSVLRRVFEAIESSPF